MCLHCGCGQPSNRHGDQRNITIGDLRQATKTSAHKTGTGGGPTKAAKALHRQVVKKRK